MSAQIINALRTRAARLDVEAVNSGDMEQPVTPENPVPRNPWTLRLIAAEFRALADQAEAR